LGVARTLNPAVHTVRREAFVEAAQHLMQMRGYEQMSIQDVLDAVDASRGAFYHYFDSKQALLEAVIDRMVDAGLGAVQPVLDDSSLDALTKLQRVFLGIGRWKTERRPLVMALLEVWLSDDNAIVREKFRRRMVGRLAGVLTPLIEQGARDGSFRIDAAPETARVLVMVILGFQDVAMEMFLDRQAKRGSLARVEETFGAYTRSLERILGAPSGSIHLMDGAVMRAWFG
jgi:AcrR family transcriptional regulator